MLTASNLTRMFGSGCFFQYSVDGDLQPTVFRLGARKPFICVGIVAFPSQTERP
jgi:hypothetical protein